MRSPPNLVEVEIEPDEGVVAALEHALDCARQGELISVSIIGLCRGNAVYLTSDFTCGLTLIGALDHAKTRVSAAMAGD